MGMPDPAPDRSTAPLIVGISGAMRFGSANEMALRMALDEVDRLGGRTLLIPGVRLDLQNYDEAVDHEAQAGWLLEAVESADGLIISSPSYHGSVSGLLKNGLDYLEGLRDHPRPYLRDRAVGCIATGDGWQGPNTTLQALRVIVHALQGWPTPIGVAHNITDSALEESRPQLRIMAEQVVTFARMRRQLDAEG